MADTAPLSALYYPHTTVADEGILRDALLLWDRVSFIVPRKGFLKGQASSLPISAAVELVGEEIEVGEPEKDAVYESLLSLIERGVPEWLTWTTLPKANLRILQEEYSIYIEKLDHRIVDLLKAHKLVRFHGADNDLYTNPAMGLLIMALLARECAGTTKHTVTDRTDAYQWLAKYAFAEKSNEQAVAAGTTQHVAKLHMLAVATLDMQNYSLSQLVEMRRREQKGNGADYRKFRHNYLNRIQDAAARLAKAKTQGDIDTIEREYQAAMRDDVKFLRDALQDNTLTAICSKETGIALAASGATLLTAGTTAATAIPAGLGILSVFQKFRTGRTKALTEHPMAWMYIASGRTTGAKSLFG
jgi:hypothetical protein